MASRNENRAASLWSNPRASPAPIVTPSRLIPATSAVDCATPTTNASRYSSVSSSRAPVSLRALLDGQFAHLSAAAKPLRGEQHQAVDHQEDRGHLRLGGQLAQLALEREPEHPGGNARHDDQPRQPLGARPRAARGQRVKERAHDQHPVASVVEQQPQRAADVQHHHERKPERLRLRLRVDQPVPAEQRREQHRVPEARDREQLGRALQSAQHDRLKVGDRRGSIVASPRQLTDRAGHGPAVAHVDERILIPGTQALPARSRQSRAAPTGAFGGQGSGSPTHPRAS